MARLMIHVPGILPLSELSPMGISCQWVVRVVVGAFNSSTGRLVINQPVTIDNGRLRAVQLELGLPS